MSQLSALVALADRLAGTNSTAAERLACRLLGESADGPWESTLNNDGSPLQICVRLSERGSSADVRLIGDPAGKPRDGSQRRARAKRVMVEVVTSYAPALEPLCHGVLEHLLPAEIAARAALPGAGYWLAAQLGGGGVAIYATARWGDRRERWSRTLHWLGRTLPRTTAAEPILNRLAACSAVVSVGLEGVTPTDARAKVYWRLEGSASLREVGLPLLDEPLVGAFLHNVVGARRIPRAAIVGSIAFNLSTGRLSDVKLDVCAHCVSRTPSDWMRRIETTVVDLALGVPPLAPIMLETAELALVGLGMDAQRAPRLNLYLKQCHG